VLAISSVEKENIVIDDGLTDNGEPNHDYVQPYKVQRSSHHSSGDILYFLMPMIKLVSDVAKVVLSVWNIDFAKVQYLANAIDGSGALLGPVQPKFRRRESDAPSLQPAYRSSPISAKCLCPLVFDENPAFTRGISRPKKCTGRPVKFLTPFYGEVVTLAPLCDYHIMVTPPYCISDPQHNANCNRIRYTRPPTKKLIDLEITIDRGHRAMRKSLDKLLSM
jgi:hypothetical protein